MAKNREEDLFASSTMSFGEHLEELRVCLTRAIIGLVLGCIVGLFVATYVVNWIETPVVAGLRRHNVNVAQDELKQKYPALSEDMTRIIDQNVLVVEEVLLEKSLLRKLLQGDST